MKIHKLRLSFTCTLEFEAETESAQEAFLAAKTYENLILSQDWQARGEIAPIKSVKETNYFSKLDIADIDPLVKLS